MNQCHFDHGPLHQTPSFPNNRNWKFSRTTPICMIFCGTTKCKMVAAAPHRARERGSTTKRSKKKKCGKQSNASVPRSNGNRDERTGRTTGAIHFFQHRNWEINYQRIKTPSHQMHPNVVTAFSLSTEKLFHFSFHLWPVFIFFRFLSCYTRVLSILSGRRWTMFVVRFFFFRFLLSSSSNRHPPSSSFEIIRSISTTSDIVFRCQNNSNRLEYTKWIKFYKIYLVSNSMNDRNGF